MRTRSPFRRIIYFKRCGRESSENIPGITGYDKKVFLQYAELGEPAIYIAFSSGLSGTYQTAVMIANEVKEEFPDFDLRIVDSKCASLGCGLAVMHAQTLCVNGNTIQEIETSVKSFCARMKHIFTVDDVAYLARGGRISKTSAFVGGF